MLNLCHYDFSAIKSLEAISLIQQNSKTLKIHKSMKNNQSDC